MPSRDIFYDIIQVETTATPTLTTTKPTTTTTTTTVSDANCDGTESFTELGVTCSLNGIIVNVPLCAFVNFKMTYYNSSLADSGCEATLKGLLVEFNIPTSNACGTIVNNNGTHLIYSNVISGSTGAKHGIISRHRLIDINFSCALQLGTQL